MCADEQLLQQQDDFVSFLRFKPVIVLNGNVDSEFESLAGWDGQGDPTDILNQNFALHLLLVNIVDAGIGKHEGAFLRPPVHVGLLDLVREDEALALKQLHEFVTLCKLDVVAAQECLDFGPDGFNRPILIHHSI